MCFFSSVNPGESLEIGVLRLIWKGLCGVKDGGLMLFNTYVRRCVSRIEKDDTGFLYRLCCLIYLGNRKVKLSKHIDFKALLDIGFLPVYCTYCYQREQDAGNYHCGSKNPAQVTG